jgi:hypothetical protein
MRNKSHRRLYLTMPEIARQKARVYLAKKSRLDSINAYLNMMRIGAMDTSASATNNESNSNSNGDSNIVETKTESERSIHQHEEYENARISALAFTPRGAGANYNTAVRENGKIELYAFVCLLFYLYLFHLSLLFFMMMMAYVRYSSLVY